MKKISKIILYISFGAAIFMPLTIVIITFGLDFLQLLPYAVSNFLGKFLYFIGNYFVSIFPDFYFSILPGILIFFSSIYFTASLTGKNKEKADTIDVFWISLFFLTLLLFVVTYASGYDSYLYNFDTIFGFIPLIGALSPNLFTFAIWITFFLSLTSCYFIYLYVVRTGYFDKNKVGSLLIGIIVSMLFSIFLIRVPLFTGIEEFFVARLYEINRNPGNDFHASTGMNYCPVPYDKSGKKINLRPPNPELIRDDIQIIGISKETIEKLQGNWPLDWNIYAELTDKFSYASDSILLFDISFLDEKGVYGGNYCGIKFDCVPKPGYNLRKQVDVLSESFQKSNSIVLSDFPVETSDEAKSSILNFEKRIEALNKNSLINNVKNGKYGISWAKLPIPPVESLTKYLDGVGYANILKNQWGMNRKMPIVMRIINEKKASSSDYDPDKDDYFYPGIDLLAAVKHYNVSLEKDVEVDWLKGYVKINNIPKKTITQINIKTFEQKEKDIMEKPNSERSIIIPIDRFGLMNINFRGGRYCFKFHEMLDIVSMDREDVGANFKNKIALVAMYYATGVSTAKDMHLSPYGDMAGIEHHAYALNTILNQDFATTAEPWMNLLFLMGIGIIMGLYLPRVKTGMSFVFLIILAVSYIAFTIFISFKEYNLLHVFPTVIIQQFVVAIVFIGFRVLTEEENVKFIRNTFSKFVAQDVVDELLNNPESIALGGAKKEVSVFFSDVRGFTTISEALGPEDLVSLLNEYLTVMTDLIIEYKGTIDKYMGDAIMAFWGAPVKNDDHAYFACVASIAQLTALEKLQREWSERGIPVLDIGIGINSGQAVVGNMGSSHRMDYTLMGDTVNLGSRLEGVTKTYGVRIVISEYTYEKVKDRVYARELDLVRVKGKLEPVRIYELMGINDESDLLKLKHAGKI